MHFGQFVTESGSKNQCKVVQGPGWELNPVSLARHSGITIYTGLELGCWRLRFFPRLSAEQVKTYVRPQHIFGVARLNRQLLN